MDDLRDKLSEILGDEDSVRRIQDLAQQLLGENQQAPPMETAPTLPDFGGVDLKSLMSLVARLQKRQEDDRTRLLLALKPHLSDERAKRVDTAVKLLKLVDLLPLLKETDLLSGLF